VVVAAKALSPKCAIMNASDNPTTTWEAREMMMGHANVKRVDSWGLNGFCRAAVGLIKKHAYRTIVTITKGF
jgi:hypothetical protein